MQALSNQIVKTLNVTNGVMKPLTVRCYGQNMGQYHYEAGVSIIKSKSKETI